MKSILSSKWGKMEICAGLFGLIGFLALFLALTISNTNFLNHTAQAQGAPAASVTTDQADYASDDMVMITGSGWQPGETVTLEIVEEPVIHDPDTLYAVADADGNISNEYIIHGHDVVQTFTLTASGMTSGSVSQTTFTNSLNPTSTASLPTTPTTVATVMTDKADYVPGETVLITGSGWEPGETVALELVEEPLIHPAETLYAIADAEGNITNAEYVIQDHDIGQTFTLTATGLSSGLIAQTTFTDACNTSLCPCGTCSGTGGSATCGTPFLSTSVICRAASGGSPCDVTDYCTGTSTTDCPNNKVASGTACPSGADADPCTLDQCDGTSNGCQHPAAPNGTPCTNGTCQSGICQTSVCGNGMVETGEVCDDSNILNGDCCSSTCQFETGSCADDGNVCTDDLCSAGVCTHPNDDTNTCGSSSDTDCDNADTCSAGVCQNNYEPPATPCTDDTNACTDDVCDGSGTCTHPNDDTNTCGSSSDTDCDNADTCSAGVCQDNNEDYYFVGFFQPVDNNGVFNMGKAGRSFPVKWQLPACSGGMTTGGYISDLGVVVPNPPRTYQVSCPMSTPMDPIEEYTDTSGMSGLHYDFTDNQFIFNWQTSKTFVNKCYKLVLELDNGMMASAYFKFIK